MKKDIRLIKKEECSTGKETTCCILLFCSIGVLSTLRKPSKSTVALLYRYRRDLSMTNPRKTGKRNAPDLSPERFCVRILLPFEHDPEIASDINESEYSRINGFGRGRRLRTLGLRFWRPPLYQLSYSPVFHLVDRQGLEPRTDRL